MIQSFQVIENQDAYHWSCVKKTGLVQELKGCYTWEWQNQNIEELLNGIKDFTEGQKRLMVLEVL
jgi:DNA helicase-2/ATP-dependent DNA helicase PcrA